MMGLIIQDVVFLVILVALSIPLGSYIYKIMFGQETAAAKILQPIENLIYKSLGINSDTENTPKEYALQVLLFSAIGFLFLFLLQLLQGVLPLNPEGMPSLNLSLAFNTAASFISNTNWQAYSGETTLSYLTQSLGLTVQNFVSAATGMAVIFALFRAFTNKNKKTIGCFWRDLTKSVLYVLLPLSIILALLLVSQGVVQNLSPYTVAETFENGAEQTIPGGPAASQIAIKQLGTNGGGFFGANSAFPFENPNAVTNILEMLSIVLIPSALCFSFGHAVKNKKQSAMILTTVLVIFIAALIGIQSSELLSTINMEGKEVVHGVAASSLWSAVTTAASNGSVNAMHDSFSPLAGLFQLLLMQLGEIVFGGIGSGLYGILAFVMLTVFIAGLMVGRTPEYLGKKIEPFDMKMISIVVITPALLTLIGTAFFVSLPNAANYITNGGAHGFTEILYAFTSMSNNNGSAFSGFYPNTAFTNIFGGLIMLLARFIPMTAVIFMVGNLSDKKIVMSSSGTLKASGFTFTVLLLIVIILIASLSFLPALALGPIADFFTH